jgi:hydrogenase-4 component E
LVGVAALAITPARSSAFAAAAVILLVKAVGITFFLALAVRRTHERTRIQADLDPLARLALTLVGVVLFELLLPPLPFLTGGQQQGVIALLGFGFAMVLTRRATMLQLMGILMCENAVALAAVCAPGGIPVIIELGAAADVIVFCSVGLAFHQRIFTVLGSGDSSMMRELRD